MIVQKIAKHTIKLYDSIEDIPIVNFQKYNKYMLIDSVIGSDNADIDTGIQKAIKFIQNNNPGNAITQLENIRHALYLVSQEISPKYLAFTALIVEIDGVPLTDLSDGNLQRIHDKLKTAPKNKIDKILTIFKKKVDLELATYFPKSSNDSKLKEAYSKLKRKVLLELESLIDSVDNFDTIDQLNTELLTLNKPLPFQGPESFEVKADKQFNDLGILIAKSLNLDVKVLTVFQFYNALEYIAKDNKKWT